MCSLIQTERGSQIWTILHLLHRHQTSMPWYTDTQYTDIIAAMFMLHFFQTQPCAEYFNKTLQILSDVHCGRSKHQYWKRVAA